VVGKPFNKSPDFIPDDGAKGKAGHGHASFSLRCSQPASRA
jgi:hypothetical protein